MRSNKFRWSRVYESSEEELLQFLNDRSIEAARMHLEELVKTDGTVAEADTTLFCVDGSMSVTINDQRIAAQAGDALKITSGQAYYIDSGFAGCTYYLG